MLNWIVRNETVFVWEEGCKEVAEPKDGLLGFSQWIWAAGIPRKYCMEPANQVGSKRPGKK